MSSLHVFLGIWGGLSFYIFLPTVYKVPKRPWTRTDSCYKVNGPQKHHSEGEEPDKTAHMLYDPMYMERPEQANSKTQGDSGCQGLGDGGWGVTANGDKCPFGVMRMSWNWTEVMVAEHSQSSKCR